MGFLHQGVCFPTSGHVRHEFCAVGQTVPGGAGQLVMHQCQSGYDPTDPTVTMAKFVDGVASGTYAAPWPPEIPCEYEGGVGLALEYFALILGFLVITWAGARVKSYFWGKHESV